MEPWYTRKKTYVSRLHFVRDEIYCLVAKDGDFYDSKESITNDSGFYVLKIKER